MSFAINSSLYIMTYSLTYCVHAIVHHSLNHVLAIVLAYAHNTLQSQAEIMPEANADGHVAENVRNADNTRHNLPSQTDRHLRNPWLQSAWTFQTIPESIHCSSNDFTLQRAVVSVQMAGIIFEAHIQPSSEFTQEQNMLQLKSSPLACCRECRRRCQEGHTFLWGSQMAEDSFPWASLWVTSSQTGTSWQIHGVT